MIRVFFGAKEREEGRASKASKRARGAAVVDAPIKILPHGGWAASRNEGFVGVGLDASAFFKYARRGG